MLGFAVKTYDPLAHQNSCYNLSVLFIFTEDKFTLQTLFCAYQGNISGSITYFQHICVLVLSILYYGLYIPFDLILANNVLKSNLFKATSSIVVKPWLVN